MRSKGFLAMLLFLVIVTGCVIEYSSYDHDELVEAYLKLQEDLIDKEAQAKSIKQNSQFYSELSDLYENLEQAADNIESSDSFPFKSKVPQVPKELPHPKDRVSDNQIRITKNQVIMNIRDVDWAYMEDSNSMDPLLDVGVTVLTIKPKSEDDIEVGDIIVFDDHFHTIPTVHRVYGRHTDEKGTYFTTKGDNNNIEDPYIIRYEDISSIVIGIIY